MRDLPKTWVSCTLEDVTIPVDKIDPGQSCDRLVSYIDISSIDNKTCRIRTPKQLPLSQCPSRARQLVKSGDVVFSTVRPYLRNIAQIPDALNGEVASTGFAVLRAAHGVDPKYLFYKATSNSFVSTLSGAQYGVSYPAVRDAQVRAQSLELPPTNEQRRIVAKIEELFSELDHGVQALTTAREQIKAYRQSILKEAFKGKLTSDFRRTNKKHLLTPNSLLTRLKDTYESFREVGEGDIENLPSLPRNYVYTYLSNLGDLARGKSKHRPRNDPRLFGGKYPFIQTGDVKAANRTILDYSQTYNEVGLAQSRLWPKGTLCITIAANIAETAFLGLDACFPDSVVGFTARDGIVLPQYVELFIKAVRAQIEAYAPATAQKNINLSTLESLLVPLCSLEEQQLLVDRVEQLLSIADALEDDTHDHLNRCESLRQAILRQAFCGRLLSQDLRDEPASELLERIRAERGGASRKGSRTTKNGREKAA